MTILLDNVLVSPIPILIIDNVSILGFLLHGENSFFGENCEKDAHNTSIFLIEL
jgi:hypothetical protein